MAKTKSVNWESLRDLVKATDKAVLTKIVTSVDGHTIYDPKHFTEHGLNASIVDAFTKTLRSGNGPKATIFGKDGEVIASLKGVYGLEVLEFIARTFGVDSWKMGRGSRASHLAEQLVASNFTVAAA